jgi:predicted nucleic acid-binding protein
MLSRQHGVLADTGPLIATLDPHDPYFEIARNEVVKIRASRIRVAVTISTVLEAYSLASRHFNTRVALRWLDEVTRSATIIEPQWDDYASAISLIQRFADQDITLFDAVLHVVAQRLELAVWTYDHHFDILATNRWYPDEG